MEPEAESRVPSGGAMAQKGCPHCGNVVSSETVHCGCGYEFTGSEPRGADVVRYVLARLSKKQSKAQPEKRRKSKEIREKGAAKARPAARKPASPKHGDSGPLVEESVSGPDPLPHPYLTESLLIGPRENAA